MKQLDVKQDVELVLSRELVKHKRWRDDNEYRPVEELDHALENISVHGSSQILNVYPYHLGEDFEEDVFHWLVELENGHVAHIWGSCGAYTGWEICGELRCDEYASLDDAFHPLGMAQRDVNGVEFKDKFYRELFDKQMDEEIYKMLTEGME